MLGVIAITSGSRTLEEYLKDMDGRGQTKERIEEVKISLLNYSKKVESGQAVIVKGKGEGSYVSNALSSGGSATTSTLQESSYIKEITEKMLMLELNNEKLEAYKNSKKLSAKLKGKIPKEIICPLTGELFFDPVMTADGSVFERKAIEIWFQTKKVNPVTGNTMENINLVPNMVIRQIANNFLDNYKDELK